MTRYFYAAGGAVLLMLAAAGMIFFFAPEDALQREVHRIFYLHVSSAIAAYGCFAVVLLGGVVYLWKDSLVADNVLVGVKSVDELQALEIPPGEDELRLVYTEGAEDKFILRKCTMDRSQLPRCVRPGNEFLSRCGGVYWQQAEDNCPRRRR